MLSWVVHYRNKYPGCLVQKSEQAFDVFQGEEHLISLVKNGAGQWQDQSEAVGCSERHDLSPLPKDARVHKEIGGKVALDDQHKERLEARKQFMDGGKVLSIEECKAKGMKFDSEGRVLA